MTLLNFLLITSCLTVIACAQPNYVPESPDVAVAPDPSPNKPVPTCSTPLPATQSCAALTWLISPNSTSYSKAQLKIDTSADLYDTVEVLLWMPSMSHGSAPVTLTNKEAGLYEISNIFFIMPGDWEVRIFLRKNKVLVDQLFIPLLVP